MVITLVYFYYEFTIYEKPFKTFATKNVKFEVHFNAKGSTCGKNV